MECPSKLHCTEATQYNCTTDKVLCCQFDITCLLQNTMSKAFTLAESEAAKKCNAVLFSYDAGNYTTIHALQSTKYT